MGSFLSNYLGKDTCTNCRGSGKSWIIFQCSSCNGSGKTDHYRLYHGTQKSTADWIQLWGFKASADGMFGPGVYTTGSWEKAKWFAQNRSQGSIWDSQAVILELDVDVGKCKTHDAGGCEGRHRRGCTCKAWINEDYDSQYVPTGEGVKREETVVRNSRQIKITHVHEVPTR